MDLNKISDRVASRIAYRMDTWGLRYSYWTTRGKRVFKQKEFRSEKQMERFITKSENSLDGFEVDAISPAREASTRVASVIPESEIPIAKNMRNRGYRHVVQITTNRGDWGPPLYFRDATEAAGVLTNLPAYLRASIKWTEDLNYLIGPMNYVEE